MSKASIAHFDQGNYGIDPRDIDTPDNWVMPSSYLFIFPISHNNIARLIDMLGLRPMSMLLFITLFDEAPPQRGCQNSTCIFLCFMYCVVL